MLFVALPLLDSVAVCVGDWSVYLAYWVPYWT